MPLFSTVRQAVSIP